MREIKVVYQVDDSIFASIEEAKQYVLEMEFRDQLENCPDVYLDSYKVGKLSKYLVALGYDRLPQNETEKNKEEE